MSSLFSSDFFAGNRRTLRKRTQAGVPILVTANGLLQRGADSTYAFAQDANFWYLTGITDPDITLVIDTDEEYLIVPFRETNRETFDGAIDTDALRERSGITKIVDETAGWKHLDSRLAEIGKLATPAPAPQYIQQSGMYANPSRARMMERIKQHVPDLQLIDIRTDLAALRMIKQEPEIAALQSAIDITSAALNVVLTPENLGAFRHEYEIEAEVFREFRKRGATGHSFEPIVAGGKNACTLHNVANNSALQAGQLLVCDVGAEAEQYAADITRTVSLGPATERQQAVYDAVQATQTYALSLLRPGALLKDYEESVAQFMGDQLIKLKVIKKPTNESIREFFPHASSHFLGLNVHDVGDYTKPLEPGVVLTCEPGIYIKGESIGVRIEDDVLITAGGNRVMTADCRKGLAPVN
jgi:Xaa-Pro aminopeptidase